MGISKSKLNALMLTGLMLSMDNNIYSSTRDLKEEDYKVGKRIKPFKAIIPKNHKEFFYGLNSVFALNQKNADKKAKAKGYLY